MNELMGPFDPSWFDALRWDLAKRQAECEHEIVDIGAGPFCGKCAFTPSKAGTTAKQDV